MIIKRLHLLTLLLSFIGSFHFVNAQTTLNFSTPSATINENDIAYDLCVTITNESATEATSVDLVLVAGDAANIDDYTTQTLTFPAADNTTQCFTLSIVDDNSCNANQSYSFVLNNALGGTNAALGSSTAFDLTVNDDELSNYMIAQQDFEGAIDNWTVTITPTTYNVNDDIWATVASLTNIPAASSGTMFWGMQDLENTNGGGAFEHTLKFEDVDVSNYINTKITFDYNADGYDTGDTLYYELLLDGVSQGKATLLEGGIGGVSTSGWQEKTLYIPSNVNMVGLVTKALQNGGSDYAGFDNFKLTGQQCACTVDAGDLATTTTVTNFSVCAGSDLLDAAEASAVFIADYTATDENNPGTLGTSYIYLLANSAGQIIDNSISGDFDFSNITTLGAYNVYGLSYGMTNTPNELSTYVNGIAGDTDLNDIAQIEADDLGTTLCLDLEGLNASGSQVSVTITALPSVSGIVGTNPTNCSSADGEITLTLAEGESASTSYTISYDLDGTAATATANSTESTASSGVFDLITIDNLAAGTYDNFTIKRNTNNCEATSTENVILSEPNAPTPNIVASSNPTTCGGNQGTITLGGLTAGLAYTVNYTRDNLNVSNGPLIADADGQVTLMNLIAAAYGSISVTETISGCTGGNLNTSLSSPTAPTLNVLPTVQVCYTDANSYDLTQLQADLTAETGTFTWFTAFPTDNTTLVATPSSTTVNDGDTFYVLFIESTTNCSAQVTVTFEVFSEVVIFTNTPTCGNDLATYTATFSVESNTSDVITLTGSDSNDYTANLTTTSTDNYEATNIPNNVNLTITVNRPNVVCAAATADITAITCCPADAGTIQPTTAQEICVGSESSMFTADYSAATDPNPSMPTGLMISEIRIDQPDGADADEFFELHGAANTSLDGYAYIVIGDGAGGNGVVEHVTDLTGSTIPQSGYFVIGMPGFTLGTIDLSVPNLNFENSDNVTHLLVQGFTGALGDDLDTDDDGVLDVTPWTSIIDDVALIETIDSGDHYYSTNTVGPNGTFVPAHVYFDIETNGFVIGTYDPTDANAADTPNEANTTPEFIYIWLATQENGASTDIESYTLGANNAPYSATFTDLAVGEYCIYGLSYAGTETDFTANNFANVEAITAAIDANTICADIDASTCTPLTVHDVMTVRNIQKSDCSSLDASGTFTISCEIIGGVAPITVNGEDITSSTFAQGTIIGSGTDAAPYIFTSANIQSQEAYSFTIADGTTVCSPDRVIEGVRDCDPCTDYAAPNALADIEVCADEPITLLPSGGGKSIAVVATDLFISEYLEGSSNNKCIELFNGTENPINLATYSLEIYFNGSTNVGTNIPLNGTIEANEVFFICHTLAEENLASVAHLTNSQLNFNGDDAIVLTKAGTPIDIFGNIGCDPGAAFTADSHATANQTLIRRANVFQGIATDPDNTVCEFPTLVAEWQSLPQNTSDLGLHNFGGMLALEVTYNYYTENPATTMATAIATADSLVITDAIVPTDGNEVTLYITAATADPVCESTPIEVNIIRNSLPSVANTSIGECMLEDGTANFTLEDANAAIDIDGGNIVTYYTSLENAENAIEALSSPYNATSGTILYARIEDTNNCYATATINLYTVDCDVSIADPCSCRANPTTSTINGNATTNSNGQFDETVTVTAPSGQTWYIQTVVGLYNEASAMPPVAPTPFVTGAAGQTLTEMPNGDGTSTYTLTGVHIDAQGYTITVTNGADILSINNQCYYPSLSMTNAPTSTCLFTPEFTIIGAEVNGGVADNATFTIQDNTGTTVLIEQGESVTIDPMTLGVGNYTIAFTFDAGTAGAGDITDPGCEQMITQNIVIEQTPSAMSCDNFVQVSVDGDCATEITPDMILEGSPGCLDDYEVRIMSVFNVNLGNITTTEMLGNTYTVRVYHLPSNNYCWGQILVEDKTAPYFECPTTPIMIECFDNAEDVPAPIAMDNCANNITVELVNQSIDNNNPCTATTITRIFTAMDDFDNQSETCQQTIEIIAPSLPDFPDNITFTCDQYAAYPNITDAVVLHSSITDTDPSDAIIDVSPTLSNTVLANTGAGMIDIATGTYCQYGFTIHDDTITTCGNNFKIIRTWTALNWCGNTVVTTDINGDDNVQIINIMDKEEPVLTRTDFVLSANVYGSQTQPCLSTGLLLPATVTDNCSDIIEMHIYTSIGEATYINGHNGINGGYIPSPGLGLGLHIITYVATDACGNIGETTATIEVKDDISPTAICDEITTTTLNSNGLAVIPAAIFDDGSNDNCGIKEFKVRKLTDDCSIAGNTVFSESVTFCCADAGEENITVELLVEDYFSNTNTCTVQVRVDEYIAPTLSYCPPAQTITCEDYQNNYQAILDLGNATILAEFGTASFYDACGLTVSETFTRNIDNCGSGTITRTFNAVDDFGNQSSNCTQTIQVQHESDFVVTFPADMDYQCVVGQNPTEDADFGEPIIYYDNCEMVAVSHEDQLFTVVPDACYKIFRTYTVVNWCQYEEGPTNIVVETPESNLPGGSLDPDGDKDDRTFKDGLTLSNYPNATPDGVIVYQQVIKVTDNVAPQITPPTPTEYCIDENQCSTTLTLPQGEAMDCSPNVTFQVSGDLGTGYGPYYNVVPGTYNMQYTATDNCGNSSSISFPVHVYDCKAPTPYCNSGIVVELSPVDTNGDGVNDNGQVQVWASDFDAGSFDNCSSTVSTSFSSDVNDISVTYTCDSIGQRPVYIWVTDESGNQDICQTSVIIESVDNVCNDGGASPSIAGVIRREDGAAIAGVEVMVNGNGANMSMTDTMGQYLVENLEMGYDYAVLPERNDNHKLGVTTLDIIYIRKHILQVELLDSPYKIIAADVNRSQSVTTSDIVQIRKLILNDYQEFPNNNSWRFINKFYDFPNPQNPWEEDFLEVHLYNNLDYPVLAADFIGIKIGDVNNSALINFTSIESSERNNQQVTLVTNDQYVRKGETVKIPFFFDKKQRLLGMQWTLDFDENALQFENINGGEFLDNADFGLSLYRQGTVLNSFVNDLGTEFATSNMVFEMTFTALANGYISEWIDINSKYLNSELYTSEYDIVEVVLEFNASIYNDEKALETTLENRPNPFKNQTEIFLTLNEAQVVTLSMFDMTGKKLWQKRAFFEKGKNSFMLDADDLDAKGILLLQMETRNKIISQKMIRL